MRHHGFTNALLLSIIAVLLVIIGAMGYRIWDEQTRTLPVPTPTIKPSLSETPSSTMTPTIGSTPTHTPTPTISDSVQLQQAFAKKYNSHTPQEVMVSISKNNGTHIWGSVKFEGEMGGGWFLAAKTNGAWVIVQDGNGTIDCATIKPYNFPTDMVSECWDAATQKLIKR